MNANDCLGFASRDCLRAVGSEWTVVTCTSGDATRELMSTASRFLMSLRLLEVVTGVSTDARSPKVHVDTRGCGCRELHAIRSNPGSPSNMEEKGFVGKMKVFSMVPRAAAAAKRAESSVPDGRRVLANNGSDQLQLRARVAQEVRGRGRDINEYFSETPHLALVKAVSAHAARLVGQCDTVAAVFDVRRAYLYAEEKRSTFVEAPDYLCADLRASQGRKLRKA